MRRWKAVLPWAVPAIGLAALPVLVGAALAPAACAGTPGAVASTASSPAGAVTVPRITIPPLRQPQPLLGEPHSILGTRTQSPNWSGYDVVTGGPFTSVTATWRQPRVRASSYFTDVAFWVGLDGDTADPGGDAPQTVEQIGTEGYSLQGDVYYDAWYEMYPAAPVFLTGKKNKLAIRAGDSVTASVTYAPAGDTPASFTLSLVNHTTGKSFTYTETVDKLSIQPERSSVEVVAEAPSLSDGYILPVANFGLVSFRGCTFEDGQPIGAFDWSRIDMVSGDTGATEVATSPLIPDGTGFSVTTDLKRPVTTVSGAGAAWHGKPVTIALSRHRQPGRHRSGLHAVLTRRRSDLDEGDVGHDPGPGRPLRRRYDHRLVPLGRQGRQHRTKARLHGAHRHPAAHAGGQVARPGGPRPSGDVALLRERPAARESHGDRDAALPRGRRRAREEGRAARLPGRHDHHLRLRLSPGGRGVSGRGLRH